MTVPEPIADRYNPLGVWKPLVHVGNHQQLYAQVEAASSDDEVQGCLLYTLVSNKMCVEFVVRTSLELPEQYLTLPEELHLWRCPTVQSPGSPSTNVHMYDGWCLLTNVDAAYLRSRIDYIGTVLNRIAFAFGSAIDWRVKYRFQNNSRGYATPSANDMNHLRVMVTKLADEAENTLIDSAIDWYNRGSSARNVFSSFLCQYIAMESIAIAVAEGDADFQLGLTHGTKQELREQKRDCIRQLHQQLYEQETLQFASRAYFDCIVGLKKNVKTVAKALFGEEHPYLSWLFDDSGELSLSRIRSDLAHGRFTLSNKADEELVRSRLSQLSEVVQQFIIQIVQRGVLGSSHGGAQWSGLHAIEMSTFDPRVYLLAGSESHLPKSDWKIRPEWCDW